MNPTPSLSAEQRAELERLAEGYCRGDLPPADAGRLNRQLRDNPAAQRFFLSCTHLHAALSWEFGPVAVQPGHAPAPAERPSGVSLWQRFLFGGSWYRRPLLQASAFAILLSFLVWIGWSWKLQQSGNSLPSDPSQRFATLSRNFGASWFGAGGPAHAGQWLPAGSYTLLSGTVEVLFTNSARLLIEGPAEFSLVDAWTVRMASGQAVLHAPPAASGFRIETSDARLIDLGTEFGVKVSPKGRTEVQVFDGKVAAEATPSGRSRTLQAGSAVRIDRESAHLFLALPYEPRRFLRQLPDPSHWPQSDQVVLNESQRHELIIARAPAAVTLDGDLSEWDVAGRFQAACQPPFAEGYGVDGIMMYDDRFLYLAAHVRDPFPMRSALDPETDGEFGWRGGGLQIRLCLDPSVPWPVDARNAMIRGGKDRYRPADLSEALVHLTLWHFAARQTNCLHLARGMDYHGQQVNPPGQQGVFRKDPNGLGYTVEYAVAWDLLRPAAGPPPSGTRLAANWTVHWSDETGRLWRGQLVEITNPKAPKEHRAWSDASLWGQALFR